MKERKERKGENMAYCVKCGAKVEDGTLSCPQCGAPIPDAAGGYSGSRGSWDDEGSGNGPFGSFEKEGYEQSGSQSYAYGQNSRQTGRQSCWEPGQAGYFGQDDVRQNKAMGVLSYLGILVLIPLLAGNRQSPYVRHHLNQGITLFVLSVIVNALENHWVWGIHSLIHFGGEIYSGVLSIVGFAIFILVIMGIVSACKGGRKELPVIGKIKIFK